MCRRMGREGRAGHSSVAAAVAMRPPAIQATASGSASSGEDAVNVMTVPSSSADWAEVTGPRNTPRIPTIMATTAIIRTDDHRAWPA